MMKVIFKKSEVIFLFILGVLFYYSYRFIINASIKKTIIQLATILCILIILKLNSIHNARTITTNSRGKLIIIPILVNVFILELIEFSLEKGGYNLTVISTILIQLIITLIILISLYLFRNKNMQSAKFSLNLKQLLITILISVIYLIGQYFICDCPPFISSKVFTSFLIHLFYPSIYEEILCRKFIFDFFRSFELNSTYINIL